MFKNRKIQLLGALILIVATVLVSLSAVKPLVSVPGASAYSDYFQRHPEISGAAGPQVELSDYALRHPELSRANTATDLSDYFLRHPDLSNQ